MTESEMLRFEVQQLKKEIKKWQHTHEEDVKHIQTLQRQVDFLLNSSVRERHEIKSNA